MKVDITALNGGVLSVSECDIDPVFAQQFFHFLHCAPVGLDPVDRGARYEDIPVVQRFSGIDTAGERRN